MSLYPLINYKIISFIYYLLMQINTIIIITLLYILLYITSF
jgi:hypothetical protein